ncbi:MAG: aspartyl-phosphate phosphatase Spo0E family protein [Bacillaceae bacterium]|nr:aspartyl-phosphate phosphatase Spo0E family protein [Bacillaceae bacterium]
MTKQDILKLIENKRAELLEIVSTTGLSSTKTLQISQELDSLMNKYNEMNFSN